MENNEKFEITAKKKNGGLFFVFIFLLAIIAYSIYMEKLLNEERVVETNTKIDAFHNNTEFICTIPINKKYLVSKSRNWSIHSEYFTKEDLLIPIYSWEEDK